jgi:hypothetical protein
VIRLEGGSDEDVKHLLNGVDKKPAAVDANNDDDVKEITDASVKEETKSSTDAGAAKNGAAGSGDESGAYSEEDEDDDEKDDEDTNDNIKRKSKKKKTSVAAAAAAATASSSTTNGNASSSSQQPLKQKHRTVSIFMRNLAPNITKQDLEEACKGYEGFKRIALSDPAPERGFYRRGWITFDADVDVKKICWSLSNIKVIFLNLIFKFYGDTINLTSENLSFL